MSNCDILFVIPSMRRGGAERQLSVLARRLQAMGYRVTVAISQVDGALLPELTDAGIPILDLQKSGRWSNLGVLRTLARFVSSERPLVVHSYLPTENILALTLKPWIARHGGAVVCGLRIAKLDAGSYGYGTYIVYMLQRILLRFADRVLSNSADALHELRRWIPSGRGHAIPNGIETDKFPHDPAKRRAQRAAWMLADDTIAIGLVGRLDPQKNHRLMITALKAVAERQENVRLVVIGEGSTAYAASVRVYAESLGVADRIIWAGPLDDMVTAYSAIDILCLPSVAEGFPNVVAEAMCTGLPCVATDVGDTAKVIGDAGWVVPSNDPDSLVSALQSAIEGLSGWDRDVPRRRIAENFSDAALAKRTLAALHPFLSDASARRASLTGYSPGS